MIHLSQSLLHILISDLGRIEDIFDCVLSSFILFGVFIVVCFSFRICQMEYGTWHHKHFFLSKNSNFSICPQEFNIFCLLDKHRHMVASEEFWEL